MKKIAHILLVDDDEITNHINKIIMEEANFSESIHVAMNGEEALDFIKNNCTHNQTSEGACPALVILDLNMPVMGGFEFLENLACCEDVRIEDIPVVLLTSSTNSQDIERANKFNISGYLQKPLTEEKVNEIISTLF